MKYISDKELKDLIDGDIRFENFGASVILLKNLIEMCKELPDQQWQTIDEFNANPVDGWCFLIHSRFNHRTIGNYSIGRFWIDGGICNEEHITHVMPIKTPEAPKL